MPGGRRAHRLPGRGRARGGGSGGLGTRRLPACYSAFVGTELETWLRNRTIETLVFAGVQTNVCVETSFRDAISRGFYGVLAVDCVASHAPPLHEATIANIGFLFGDVLPREAIAGHWKG